MIHLKTPLTKAAIARLKCGQEVLLTGTIFTARDAAHKKIKEYMTKKRKLPFNIRDMVIYYAGPTPGRKDGRIGSCGPTTSSRMDSFTPALLNKGLLAMIGKGRRSECVRKAIKKRGGIYFLTAGGAGAYIAKRIIAHKIIAFNELGPEAVHELEVKDFPLIVAIDSKGNDIFSR